MAEIIYTDDPMTTIVYIRKPKSQWARLREEARAKAQATESVNDYSDETGSRFHRLFSD